MNISSENLCNESQLSDHRKMKPLFSMTLDIPIARCIKLRILFKVQMTSFIVLTTMKFPFFSTLWLTQILMDHNTTTPQPRCKTMPDDPSWPSNATWDSFNASVDGRLIHTIPIAAPCHRHSYDPAKCDLVKNQWHQPPFQ